MLTGAGQHSPSAGLFITDAGLYSTGRQSVYHRPRLFIAALHRTGCRLSTCPVIFPKLLLHSRICGVNSSTDHPYTWPLRCAMMDTAPPSAGTALIAQPPRLLDV